ncbi:MAG: hypothetical protein AVO35_09725 [Candidatus Aegiribacteria sp. MLS_C]|nr:MAG: hypothetical protein AVO35_09725 [Candidatus Aegiribacteria sp. MLS_C]
MLDIYVDGDGCPVKDEVFRVASRYDLKVFVVSNSWMRIPESSRVQLILVEEGTDVADDWIAEHVEKDDIVISGDIPLASRCLKRGAGVIGNTGRPFDEDNICDALSVRNLLHGLREEGMMIGGPKPFDRKDRSRFLQALDEMIVGIRRRNASR